MNKLDFNSINIDISSTLNSAYAVAQQSQASQETIDELSKINAKRDATMMAGAEAGVAQKKLLEEQLAEIRAQNSQLKENNRLLNELYESAKRDAVDSAKEARHNKIFGWVSLIIGTLIGIAGIVFGIIF